MPVAEMKALLQETRMLHVVTACMSIALVHGFPSGAPPEACQTRKPDPVSHGAEPQTSDCPFVIIPERWAPGKLSNMVLIHDQKNQPFRGYLISVMDSEGKALGSFSSDIAAGSPSNQTSKVICNGTSLTHGDRSDKDYVQIAWMPPSDLPSSANLMISYVVVQNQATYWINCNQIDFPNAGELPPPETAIAANPAPLPVVAVSQLPGIPPAPTHPPVATVATTGGCGAFGNTFTQVPGTGCKEYYQTWSSGQIRRSCGILVFDYAACSCAFTTTCLA